MEENRIKEARIRSNLTLRELSKLIHVDYSYLSKLEKGEKRLTEEMAIRLASFFSVDKNFILGNKVFSITCYTSDLKQTFSLDSIDVKEFGLCYTSKLQNNGLVINIINENIEYKLLTEKHNAIRLMKKMLKEEEIIKSMDNWTTINLMYAQARINELLKKR